MDITDVLDHPGHPRRRIDTLARLQKDMQLVKRTEQTMRPLRQWEELQRHLAPLRQMEQMKRHLEPFHKWEAQQKLLAPLGHWEQLQKSAGLHVQRMLERHLPIKQVDLHLRALHDAPHLNVLRDAVAAHELVRSASQHGQLFNKFQQPTSGGILAQELARQFEYANPALSAFAEAQKTFDRLAASFQHIDAAAFEHDDGDEETAEQEVEAITEAAAAEPTLAAAVAQIAAAIEAQQNPSVQLTLWLYFKELMKMLAGAYISFLVSQQLTTPVQPSQPQAVKSIKVAARSIVDSPEILGEYRFVSARAVNVRQNPKARSPKLAELPFGSAVRLLRKDGDFALVVWMDTSSGAEIHGWVFARYLQKFS
jgi:hypothetical protein